MPKKRKAHKRTNAEKSECATFSISHTSTHVRKRAREWMRNANVCTHFFSFFVFRSLTIRYRSKFLIALFISASLFEILQLHGTMWSAPYFISGCMPHNQFQLHNNNSLNALSWFVLCMCLFVRCVLHFMCSCYTSGILYRRLHTRHRFHKVI